MKQTVKRFFTGLAAFAMVIGTGVSPIAQVLAEETTAPTETPVTTSVPESTETPVPSEVPAESAEPTSSPVPSMTPEVVETPTPSTTPEVTTSSEQTEVAANSVVDDINDPVIERVEIVNNKGEFTTDDTVRINVYAYDADSGIQHVYINLGSISGGYTRYDLEKGTEENQYFVEIPLTDYLPGTYYISNLTVTDNNTNSTSETKLNDYESGLEFTWMYYFVVSDDGFDNGVKSLTFDENGAVFNSEEDFSDLGVVLETNQAFGSNASIELKFTIDDESTNIYRTFVLDAIDEEGKQFGFSHDYSGSTLSVEKLYEYKLSSICVRKTIGAFDLVMENMSSYKFSYNYTAPEIGEEDPFIAAVNSVELSHQGEFVKAGDVVDITVYAEANQPMGDTAQILFRSSKTNIAPSDLYLDLYFDESKGAYTGQWTIEEDRYSCEWYAYRVEIRRENSNDYRFVFAPNNYPDYVKVKNGDAYSDPSMNVNFQVFAFDKDSWDWEPVQESEISNVSRRTTLNGLGIALPEMSSPVDGMNQIGWVSNGDYTVTQDSEILASSGYLHIYAQYDRAPYTASYSYYDNTGNLKIEEKHEIADPGMTYASLKEHLHIYEPTDITTQYDFSGWQDDNYYYVDDAVIPANVVARFSLTSLYNDAKMIYLDDMYYDETGLDYDAYGRASIDRVIMADPSATYEEVVAEANELPLPAMYPGMIFDHWESNFYDTYGRGFGPGSYINRTAVYQNSLVRILLYKGEPSKGNLIYSSFEVRNAGETYAIPETIDGHNRDSIQWMHLPAGENWQITLGTKCEDNDIVGYVSEDIDNPSVDPSDPTEPEIPAVRPDEGTLNNTVNEIVNAEAGETVTIEMGNANVLTREVLEAAKGKDVTLVLKMNGYTWTINGKDIVATELKDINMGVMIDSGAIPSGVVNELAGNNPTRQLTLAHEGDFGFRANLTINVGAEHAGKVGNLFYYNSDHRMIFMSDPTVGADGSVTFPFSHASSYVIVLSDASMRPASDKEETGVYNSTLPYAAAIIISAVAAGYVLKKRHAA